MSLGRREKDKHIDLWTKKKTSTGDDQVLQEQNRAAGGLERKKTLN